MIPQDEGGFRWPDGDGSDVSDGDAVVGRRRRRKPSPSGGGSRRGSNGDDSTSAGPGEASEAATASTPLAASDVGDDRGSGMPKELVLVSSTSSSRRLDAFEIDDEPKTKAEEVPPPDGGGGFDDGGGDETERRPRQTKKGKDRRRRRATVASADPSLVPSATSLGLGPVLTSVPDGSVVKSRVKPPNPDAAATIKQKEKKKGSRPHRSATLPSIRSGRIVEPGGGFDSLTPYAMLGLVDTDDEEAMNETCTVALSILNSADAGTGVLYRGHAGGADGGGSVMSLDNSLGNESEGAFSGAHPLQVPPASAMERQASVPSVHSMPTTAKERGGEGGEKNLGWTRRLSMNLMRQPSQLTTLTRQPSQSLSADRESVQSPSEVDDLGSVRNGGGCGTQSVATAPRLGHAHRSVSTGSVKSSSRPAALVKKLSLGMVDLDERGGNPYSSLDKVTHMLPNHVEWHDSDEEDDEAIAIADERDRELLTQAHQLSKTMHKTFLKMGVPSPFLHAHEIMPRFNYLHENLKMQLESKDARIHPLRQDDEDFPVQVPPCPQSLAGPSVVSSLCSGSHFTDELSAQRAISPDGLPILGMHGDAAASQPDGWRGQSGTQPKRRSSLGCLPRPPSKDCLNEDFFPDDGCLELQQRRRSSLDVIQTNHHTTRSHSTAQSIAAKEQCSLLDENDGNATDIRSASPDDVRATRRDSLDLIWFARQNSHNSIERPNHEEFEATPDVGDEGSCQELPQHHVDEGPLPTVGFGGDADAATPLPQLKAWKDIAEFLSNQLADIEAGICNLDGEPRDKDLGIVGSSHGTSLRRRGRSNDEAGLPEYVSAVTTDVDRPRRLMPERQSINSVISDHWEREMHPYANEPQVHFLSFVANFMYFQVDPTDRDSLFVPTCLCHGTGVTKGLKQLDPDMMNVFSILGTSFLDWFDDDSDGDGIGEGLSVGKKSKRKLSEVHKRTLRLSITGLMQTDGSSEQKASGRTPFTFDDARTPPTASCSGSLDSTGNTKDKSNHSKEEAHIGRVLSKESINSMWSFESGGLLVGFSHPDDSSVDSNDEACSVPMSDPEVDELDHSVLEGGKSNDRKKLWFQGPLHSLGTLKGTRWGKGVNDTGPKSKDAKPNDLNTTGPLGSDDQEGTSKEGMDLHHGAHSAATADKEDIAPHDSERLGESSSTTTAPMSEPSGGSDATKCHNEVRRPWFLGPPSQSTNNEPTKRWWVGGGGPKEIARDDPAADQNVHRGEDQNRDHDKEQLETLSDKKKPDTTVRDPSKDKLPPTEKKWFQSSSPKDSPSEGGQGGAFANWLGMKPGSESGSDNDESYQSCKPTEFVTRSERLMSGSVAITGSTRTGDDETFRTEDVTECKDDDNVGEPIVQMHFNETDFAPAESVQSGDISKRTRRSSRMSSTSQQSRTLRKQRSNSSMKAHDRKKTSKINLSEILPNSRKEHGTDILFGYQKGEHLVEDHSEISVSDRSGTVSTKSEDGASKPKCSSLDEELAALKWSKGSLFHEVHTAQKRSSAPFAS